MKKNAFNLIIVSISLIILVTFVFKTDGIEQLSKLNVFWVSFSFLFMFFYWFFESLSLHVITLSHGIREKIRESFSITMVGQFFNSVTPFATGGQPAQLFYFMKGGIDTGNASSIVMMKFISFQTVLTVYSFLVIILSFHNFNSRIPFLLTMTILGLSVHASMILITLLFTYNRVLTEKIIKFVFRLLKKIRIVKGEEAAEEKLEDSLTKFHDNAALLKSNPKLLIKTATLTFIQLTFYFSIPYCLYRSFGFSDISYFNLFTAAVFVTTVVSVIPLPGQIGGAEGSFYLFFQIFFGSVVIPAMLIWRIVTYYSCIGLGWLFTVILPQKTKKCET